MASIDDDNSNSNLTNNSSTSNISSASQQSLINLKSSMLRPSALSSWNSSSLGNTTSATNNPVDALNSNSSSSFPVSAVNPFAKVTEGGEENGATAKEKKDEEHSSKSDTESKAALISRNGLMKSNLFSTSSAPISNNVGFVFGQNLHERVTGKNIDAKDEKSNQEKESSAQSVSNDSGASNSGLLFSTAAQQPSQSAKTASNSQKSLTEVAREYEESRAQKRKFEEVETITGEEDEKNILDINCKLFTYSSCTWEERGRGSLRLNDPKSDKTNGISRVVFRTSGSHRVLLNTKIWRGMVAERASQKSIRLTAIDSSGHVKVYLVMTRPSDIDTLYMALRRRIEGEMLKNPLNAREEEDLDKSSEAALSTEGAKHPEHDEEGETAPPSPKKKVTENESDNVDNS
ncbi:ran-binding protein 3 [Sergentomyia squamirostris]